MGCASSKDVDINCSDTITAVTVQSGILEFDQMYLLMQEIFKQAEEIRLNVVSNRVNMINITKAHLIHNPTIVDAYRLWVWAVALCNKGEQELIGVEYSINPDNGIDYDLGKCGEVRLLWFGICLNNFIIGVAKAQHQLPEIMKRMQYMFDRIKTMKDKINGYMTNFKGAEKQYAINKVISNINSIANAIQVADEFQKLLVDYTNEVSDIILRNHEIQAEAEVMGKKLLREFDVILLEKVLPTDQEHFRMRVKMNCIVLLYYDGIRRTQEEEQTYYNIKAERQKERGKQFNFDKNPTNENDFPYKLTWTGYQPIDLSLGEIQLILEDHNVAKKQFKQYRNLIKHYSYSYVLEDDNIIEAWRIFCWAAINERGQFDYMNLENIRFKDSKLAQLSSNFQGYIKLVEYQQTLQIQWRRFNEFYDILMKQWWRGDFIDHQQFKKVKLNNQYNIMTCLAKNIYRLKQYYQDCQRIYLQKFQKKVDEALQFNKRVKLIYDECISEKDQIRNLRLEDLASQYHKGAKKQQDEILQKALKYQQFVNENTKLT